jgi:hypothetical protein
MEGHTPEVCDKNVVCALFSSFNLAIDSKLRGFDVIAFDVDDVAPEWLRRPHQGLRRAEPQHDDQDLPVPNPTWLAEFFLQNEYPCIS